MEDGTEKTIATPMPDLTPLAVQRDGAHLKFTIRTQEDILAQLPEDYERRLSDRLGELLADPTPFTTEVSLAGLAGISSRQLGSLIALGKVLRPRFGTLTLTNISPPVLHLLKLTRVDQLFNLA